MYTARSLLFRNTLVAVTTGLVTLVILLIAPLGLAAVLTCTAAVVVTTFLVGTTSDRILRWLESARAVQLVDRDR
jgi:VIT1/CCC1 family predicted Fe2+/Mn2+ transporter